MLPPTFQPRLQAEGKPPLAIHTRVAVPCFSSSLEGGRRVRVGRTTPTGGERGEKRQRDEDEGKLRTDDFLYVINETEELLLLNIIHSVSDHQPQGSSVNVAEKVH